MPSRTWHCQTCKVGRSAFCPSYCIETYGAISCRASPMETPSPKRPVGQKGRLRYPPATGQREQQPQVTVLQLRDILHPLSASDPLERLPCAQDFARPSIASTRLVVTMAQTRLTSTSSLSAVCPGCLSLRAAAPRVQRVRTLAC